MLQLLAAIPFSATQFGPFTIVPEFEAMGHLFGPLQVHSFGLLVAIGLFIALSFGSRYTEKTLGESGETFQNFGIMLIIIGWICAHVFDVLFYQPEEFLEDPLILLKVWGSISSYGGLFGGIIGAFVWKQLNPDKDFVRFCEVAAMSLTFGWLFGRMGCATVHDHPGSPTDFFLGVEFPDGVVRHDLGLYEAIWWVVICTTVVILSRKPKPRGFFLALIPMMYAPARFCFDFLRVGPEEGGDVRYFGLTPAQYFSIGIFLVGLYFLVRLKGAKPEPWVQYVPPRIESDEDDAKYYKSNSTTE